MKKRVLCVLSTSIIMAFRNYDGKKFSIVTTGNNAQNIYIRSARLNGNDYTKCYIEYRDIMKGGTLELTVSDKPNTNFGTWSMNDPYPINLFKKLYMENAPRLTYFANKYVDPGTAEDIVQDVFLKVWQKNLFLLSGNGLKTYLFNAIRNACLDYLKHQSVEQNYMSTVIHKLKVEELEYSDPSFLLFQEDDRMALIYNEIEKLPEKCREIFTLSYLHEKKSSEIANMLNISRRTVEAQLYKALKLIRDALHS